MDPGHEDRRQQGTSNIFVRISYFLGYQSINADFSDVGRDFGHHRPHESLLACVARHNQGREWGEGGREKVTEKKGELGRRERERLP